MSPTLTAEIRVIPDQSDVCVEVYVLLIFLIRILYLLLLISCSILSAKLYKTFFNINSLCSA